MVDIMSERFVRQLEELHVEMITLGSLCEKAHIYIWDEPLNFIDIISRMQIENVLIRCRPTMVFVEHDISFCENVATKVIELKRV